jgi:hypothetical protein
MNLWHMCPKRHLERFPSRVAFTVVPCFLFLWPDQPLYTVKNIVYINTSDCAQTVYALLLLLNNTASVTLLHQSGVVLCTEWVFMTGALAGSDVANTWHWTKRFAVPSIKHRPKSPNQNQVSIPFPVQKWLQCFFSAYWLAWNLTAHTLCCFVSEQLIPSDIDPWKAITSTSIEKWKFWGMWQKFTLLLIELWHFLDSKKQIFTI